MKKKDGVEKTLREKVWRFEKPEESTVPMQEMVQRNLKKMKDVKDMKEKDSIPYMLELLVHILAADYDLRASYFKATMENERQRQELNKVVKIQSLTPEMFSQWIRENRGGIVTHMKAALPTRPES